MKTKLERLAAVSKDLNMATDHLNATIADLEESLRRLGVCVFVSVSLPPEVSTREEPRLAYKKEGRHWQFVYQYTEKDEIVWTPLLSAPRQVRMLAVERIPALIDMLIVTTEASITRCDEQSATLSELAEEIRAAAAKVEES
jgi:hypothetical protein